MTNVEDYIRLEGGPGSADIEEQPGVKDNVKDDNELEISLKTGVAEKQESLAILASLGTTKNI